MTSSHSQIETANLFISDGHYGKETELFSPKVFAKQLDSVVEKTSRIRELLKAYDFERLIVWNGGDANDGTLIYAEQSTEQALTNVEQQADELADLYESFLLKLKKVWRNVEFEGVPGNHGRSGKGAHVAANWDIVCYNYLRRSMRGSDVPINFGDTGQGMWVRMRQVYGHKFLLYHGHHIKMHMGVPWYGIQTRISRWLSGKRIGKFDVAMLGHFHTTGHIKVNSVEVLMSGTTVLDDDWALTALGYEPSPIWRFFGTSRRYATTWSFPIDLTV